MSPQVLERFHRALVEEIQTQRPEYLTSPFTVAEIYQKLVPYGSHRDRIGVEINGDYEDALIRLLAGEGGFLVLESEPALRDLRAELSSPNPNTGLYREFAAVDVRLNPAFLDLPFVAAQLGIVPPGVDIFADPVPRAANTASVPDVVTTSLPDMGSATGSGPSQLDMLAQDGCVCPSCRGDLPQGKKLNFCPFCGTDLAIIVCSACREEVEADWRFCAFCGQEAGE